MSSSQIQASANRSQHKYGAGVVRVENSLLKCHVEPPEALVDPRRWDDLAQLRGSTVDGGSWYRRGRLEAELRKSGTRAGPALTRRRTDGDRGSRRTSPSATPVVLSPRDEDSARPGAKKAQEQSSSSSLDEEPEVDVARLHQQQEQRERLVAWLEGSKTPRRRSRAAVRRALTQGAP